MMILVRDRVTRHTPHVGAEPAAAAAFRFRSHFSLSPASPAVHPLTRGLQSCLIWSPLESDPDRVSTAGTAVGLGHQAANNSAQ